MKCTLLRNIHLPRNKWPYIHRWPRIANKLAVAKNERWPFHPFQLSRKKYNINASAQEDIQQTQENLLPCGDFPKIKVHSSQRVRRERSLAHSQAMLLQILHHHLSRDSAYFPAVVCCIFIDTRAHVSDVVFICTPPSQTSLSLQLRWMTGWMDE